MAGLAGAPGPARAGNALGLSRGEWARAGLFAVPLFLALGTITALWPNPLFVRMTPVSAGDHALLTAEALLLGLYLGVRAPGCALGRASLGGLLGVVGFGCALCNKVLLLMLGAPLILQFVEPWRHLLGGLGMVLLAMALWHKARRRPASAAIVPTVAASRDVD